VHAIVPAHAASLTLAHLMSVTLPNPRKEQPPGSNKVSASPSGSGSSPQTASHFPSAANSQAVEQLVRARPHAFSANVPRPPMLSFWMSAAGVSWALLPEKVQNVGLYSQRFLLIRCIRPQDLLLILKEEKEKELTRPQYMMVSLRDDQTMPSINNLLS
jgi:hypothetical protein